MFGLLGDIANAAILSEVILELGDGRPSPDRKVDLTVYIDAPIAMDALGLSGAKAKEYSAAIIENLVKIGAKPAIFDHSVEEVRDNLHGLLQQDVRDRKGVTADAIRSGEVDISFVAAVKNNVEEYIQKCGIQILNRPETTLSVQQRSKFTRDDEQYLFSKLNSLYAKEKALDRDILSIRMVVCKRDGHVSTDVFRAKHLMLTRNNLLPSVSGKMLEENKQTHRSRVPPVESVSKISAALWLELGPSEKVDISRKQLVAACSRVASVRPEILDKLYSVLQRIVPEKAEQFKVMISNPHHIKTVMNFTAGSEEYITDKTAVEAFDRLSSEMVAEERKKGRQREKRQADKYKDHVSTIENQLANAWQVTASVEEQANSEIEHRRRSVEAILNPILARYELLGWLVSFLWVIVVILVAIEAFLPADWLSNSGPTLLGLALLVGLLSAFGSHFFGIKVWFRKRGESAAIRKAEKLAFLKDGEDLAFYEHGWCMKANVTGKIIQIASKSPTALKNGLFADE